MSEYLKLQYSAVGGLYALACSVQILLLIPSSFMIYVTMALSALILLRAQIKLYDDMIFGQSGAFYQNLPIGVTKLVACKIFTGATGIWLIAAVMGLACALSKYLSMSSMTMYSFLMGDERVKGLEQVIGFLVSTSDSLGQHSVGQHSLGQHSVGQYSLGQYSLWYLNLLLLGAAISAGVFLIITVYRTVKRDNGSNLVALLAGLAAAVAVCGLCFLAMSGWPFGGWPFGGWPFGGWPFGGWPFGGEEITFTARAAAGCMVNLFTVLLWGTRCGGLLKKWYAM